MMIKPAEQIPSDHFNIAGNEGATGAVSSLLLRALSLFEQDEPAAVDCLYQAARLLDPEGTRRDGEKPSMTPGARKGGLAPWQISRVNRHLAANLQSTILIEELASQARISASHFSGAFKVSYGTSPHRFILLQRVELAKDLMVQTNAPLCEIALDCGFADQAHLSRIFRRHVGSTPSVWRRLNAGGQQTITSHPTRTIQTQDYQS